MKKLALAAVSLWLLFAAPAFAVNVNIDGLPAATSVIGANLYECEQAGVNNKCTATQIAAFIYGLMSGDATASGTGAVTFATVNANVGSFGSATQCTVITVNAKGLITAASQTACTPAVGSITGLATGIATWLATPSSANLAAALTDETGSGAAVFGTAPTISSLTVNTALTLGFLTGAGTECVQVSNTGVVSGTGSACGGSGSTGANPTATAGDVAVNGSATTFLRSDGAPAIQKASSSLFGLAKVDNSTITASGGVISAVNNGTVTSVGTGCGTTGGPITGSGTISAASTLRANTATTDTIVSTDCGNVVTESNAASIAVALPVASTSGFGAGTFFQVCNISVGVATITPTTSQIGGASSKAIQGGTATNPSCLGFQSDGANYNIVALPVPAGLFTVTGALKGSGAGVVSPAACADLSNGATGCSTTVGTAATANTGTSSGTLPFLNGTNTFSGTQTFGSVFGAVTTQAGTTYTLASTDCGTEVVFTNASAVTVTIPATLTTGCNIAILQTTSAGQVTVTGTAVSAATLHNAHSYTKTFGQWALIGINIETTGVAILTGDGA